MKTHFKSMLVLILLVACTSISAQELTFGAKGGLNASMMIGDTKGSKIQPGFHLGMTVDYEFSKNIYLMSGLELTTKGGTEKNGSGARLTAWPLYIQMPIHVGTKFEINNNIKLAVHAGPYVAYGISGRYKIKGSSGLNGSWNIFSDGVEYNTSILTDDIGRPILSKDLLDNPSLYPNVANRIVSTESPFALGMESNWVNTQSVIANSGQQLMKKFDFGVGIGIRVEFDKFDINIGYEISALNTAKRTIFKHNFTDDELNQIGDDYKNEIEAAKAMGSATVYKTPDYKIRNGNLYAGIGVRF
ncbi:MULTISPECIES: outer membrane beta-barrel protein [unclassified Dysgonomonas]|uniref:outer membrane beta-barrel protein n=1 Tax=unclassified Dysgonomonas TaxID=2630389 RepID=UPI002476E5FC|nr:MULTISPECIES: outer membrane beta-barrel protein [unclassified Dysgonomonas]